MAAAFTASGLGVSAGPARSSSAVSGGLAVGVLVGLLMERSVRPVDGELRRTIVTLAWLLGLQGLLGWLFGYVGGAPGRHAVPLRPGGGPALARGRLQLGPARGDPRRRLGRSRARGLLPPQRPRRRHACGRRPPRRRPAAGRARGPGRAGVLDARRRARGLSGVLVTPLLGRLDTVDADRVHGAGAGGRPGRRPDLAAADLRRRHRPGRRCSPSSAACSARRPASTSSLALLVILAALLVRRRSGRVDVAAGGLPSVHVGPLPSARSLGRLALSVAWWSAVVWCCCSTPPSWRYNVADVSIWSLAVLSIVLLTGVVGQISLCQAVFMAVGAFGAGIAVEARAARSCSPCRSGRCWRPSSARAGRAAGPAAGAARAGRRDAGASPSPPTASSTSRCAAGRHRATRRPVPRPRLRRPGRAPTSPTGALVRWSGRRGLRGRGRLRRVAAARPDRRGPDRDARVGGRHRGHGLLPGLLKLRGFAAIGLRRRAGRRAVRRADRRRRRGIRSTSPARSRCSPSRSSPASGSVPGAVLGGLIVVLSTLSFGGGDELASDVRPASSRCAPASPWRHGRRPRRDRGLARRLPPCGAPAARRAAPAGAGRRRPRRGRRA